jgi:hypothetical protein
LNLSAVFATYLANLICAADADEGGDTMKTRLGIVTIMIGLALLTCSEQALSS